MRVFWLWLTWCTLFPVGLPAQETTKKPLSHDVYDSWKRITGESVSADGQRVLYTVEPQEGDASLILLSPASGRRDTIARGTGGKFTDDGRYAAFLIKPVFADVRKARIAKKKGDDLPKDSAGIIRLDSGTVTRIPRVKSFAVPERGSAWIAIQLEKDSPAADSSKRRGQDDHADAPTDDKEKKPEPGTPLIVRELDGGREYRYPFVSEYLFTKDGARLLFSTTGNDSTIPAGVFAFDTRRKSLDTLALGRGTYTQIAWDDSGKQAAFLADRDTTKRKQRYFSLYHWTPGSDSARRIVDTATTGFRPKWCVNENGDVWFSKNGRRVFFGTAPVPVPDDTTFNDEVTAQLDVWSWQDPFIQTHQLKNLEAEKKKAYLALFDLSARRFLHLGDPDLPAITPGNEGDADIALGLSDVPYRRELSWDGTPWNDVVLIDMTTGYRRGVLRRHRGAPTLSPRGNYLAWFDGEQRQWCTMNTHTGRTANPTSRITVPLYDELNDLPDLPRPHGNAGWTADDRGFLVYDRFDIWLTDPEGMTVPVNLTAGNGRGGRVRYRALHVDPEERFWTKDATILLQAFNERDKSAGFSLLRLLSPGNPERLLMAPFDFSRPMKARRDSTYLLMRSCFRECPDLYLCGSRFDSLRRLSDINPQQKDYLWGSVELMHWKMTDGTPLEGLLYKPEAFDARKKYPLLVYYYERNSDYLHRYWPPGPSRSTVNPAFYTSRGYVFFIPDIRYRIGHPGASALDAILTGTRKILAGGFVDSTRMGLQGQSWGGYQTAFLITRTNFFRAAMAGAAVANMTSAYGGIRLESGLIRMFQYEKEQSRIGATLWEKPELFLENSPLFRADRIRTPLLIMHNDNDGAVPWQQGIELYGALRRLNKPVWMLVYNNEQHNLTQRKNMKDLSLRMAQFFDHYLKGEPMPVWMKRGRPAIDKANTMATDLVEEHAAP